MPALTEEGVLQRTKCKGLDSVKKLNIWGTGTNDVSVLRRMPALEIASCSVNSISTLADFAHCPRLQELYIRKNEVRDLAEICHLKSLPDLTSLWLLDNPCANHNNYRFTVLKHLPRLQKLDNVGVTKEEVQQAAVCGDELSLASSDGPELDSFTAPEHTLSVDFDEDPKHTRQTSDTGSSSSEKESKVDKTSHSIKKLDKEDSIASYHEEEQCAVTESEVSQQTPRNDHKNSNVLQALLLLVQDLDRKELTIVQESVNQRLTELT